MNKQELIKNIKFLARETSQQWPHEEMVELRDVLREVNKLDEPEVLSSDWIDEHKVARVNNLRKMTMSDVVPIDDLQNLIVPKQELPVIPKFVSEWYESEGKLSSWWNWFYKWGRDEGRSDLETKTIRWMQDYNEEKFVDMFLHGYEVEEEPKYYVIDKEDNILLIRGYGGIEKADSLKITNSGGGALKLTEQEIKDFDPRYWAFRKPV